MVSGKADLRLVRAAATALKRPPTLVGKVDLEAAEHPGLYAFYGSAATWRELGLGTPPDDRPLYVGKAESTLAARDLEGHFGMATDRKRSPSGSSTVRRSLAALLGYRGRPRRVPATDADCSNYGLAPAADIKLSAWMKRRIKVSLWPYAGTARLADIEKAVLQEFVPPLNLKDVETPWRRQVKAARAVLAQQARKTAR